jgi:hypothetical protein
VRVSLAALYVITWSGPVRHALVEAAPWPLTLFGAPWTPLPVLALFVIASRRATCPHQATVPPARVAAPKGFEMTASRSQC